MAPSPAAVGRRRRTPACNNPPAPGKRRRRRRTPPSSSPVTAWAFPVDVLLEIVARSDARTLVRCAAVCKPLRRVTCGQDDDNPGDRIVPPRLLGYLHTYVYDKERQDEGGAPPAPLFSLVHPDPANVTAARSFSDHHLSPFISRSAATDLLGVYEPVTSRGGLAVLRRRNVNRRRMLERLSDMCVYNPMTGERTFFSYPEGYWNHYHLRLGDVFALLTADDGIGCAFMLLLADLSGFHQDSRGGVMKVQAMRSDAAGIWSPKASGHLRQLRLLAVRGFVVSAWLLAVEGRGWEPEAVIPMERRFRLLCPEIAPGPVVLEFVSSGERSGVALLQIGDWWLSRGFQWHIVLEVATGEMSKTWGPYWDYLLVELDLPSRLQTMKIF